MAKIVFVNIPAHGHTNPTLAVAKALVERGHQVSYYSGTEMRMPIDSTGAAFRAYPEPMPAAQEVANALTELIGTTLLLIEISESHTAWFIAEMRREAPDLIIYDSAALWGYVAARTLGIKHICSVTTFVLEGSQNSIPKLALLRHVLKAIPHLPRIGRWKRFMRTQFGRANTGGITEYARVNLVYTSKEFHPNNSYIDERFRFVGPSLHSATQSVEFPFGDLGWGTVVYISLGTVVNRNIAFYQAAFQAFKDFSAKFVLSVGTRTDISSLGAVPKNFIVRNVVPQLEILARADAFITHGGLNSVHEGLLHAVPEVVVPHHMEQLLNGIRVAQVGAGVLLNAQLANGHVTAAQLKEALTRVISEPSYKRQAAHFGETLKAAGGHMQAIREIEAYLGQ